MFNKYSWYNKFNIDNKKNNLTLDIKENSSETSNSSDISDYDDIYFKKYYSGIIGTKYTHKNRLILNSDFNIDNRYQILNNLGKGAFSDVYKCKDHKNNNIVAIKVIRNERRFHRCAYDENKLYEKIQKNSNCVNVINLQRFFTFNNDLFFVFEIHGISLYNYYQDSDNIINMKDFSKQILEGLVYLHNFNIIHGDLKPENILIKDNILKIIDLGSSFEEKENKYNNYVQSRWYRSPEVLFNYPITRKIDVWSYGCIIYELYHRVPLFRGKNSEDMKEKINILVDKLNNCNYFFVENNFNLNLFINLCLKFNYEDRLNANELIKNRYFKPSINL